MLVALLGERGGGAAHSCGKLVHILVGHLRWALGSSVIETMPGGYRLALPGDDFDVVRFEALVGRARTVAAGVQ